MCGNLSKTGFPVREDGRCTRKWCQKARGYNTSARYALGVDPGIANCEYAVVSRNKRGQFRVLDAGCIKQSSDVSRAHRLLTIAEKIEGLLLQYASLSMIAIENVFFNQNVSSAISTRQVIGAVSVAGAKHGVKVGSDNKRHPPSHKPSFPSS